MPPSIEEQIAYIVKSDKKDYEKVDELYDLLDSLLPKKQTDVQRTSWYRKMLKSKPHKGMKEGEDV